MSDNLELIDTLLTCQTRAIRWQIALAALLIIIGLAIFGIGTILDPLGTGFSKNLVSLIGACASTLARSLTRQSL